MSDQPIPNYPSRTLVEHIRDTMNGVSSIRYCFILGAGASRTSGIKTGGELAEIWMNDIRRIFPTQYEGWQKENGIDERDLASSYGKIYEKRFELNRVQGYEFIQDEISKSQPSYGYSILARLLSSTQHNVVITTNFDPLTEDALFIYTENRPLVCGHESLSEFVRPTNSRPVIIKVHRDQLFAPKNANDELSKLERGFKDSLDRILQTYKPIVIGYGGNDPSLMDYLKECALLDGLFWCKRPGDSLSSRIQDLLIAKGGRLIEIPGFDELFLQIQAELFKDDPPLDELIIKNARTRGEEWGKQFATLSGELKTIESEEALSKLLEGKKIKTWWDVLAAANAEKDKNRKEQIFLKGLDVFKENAYLYRSYAQFVFSQGKITKAQPLFLKALSIDPNNAFNNYAYADYLHRGKKNFELAEKHFKKAIELEPNVDGFYYYVFADFLASLNRDNDLANSHFQKAIELSPENSFYCVVYAEFLREKRKDFDEAEKYYKKALQIEPEDDFARNAFYDFLLKVRNDSKLAAKYAKPEKTPRIRQTNMTKIKNSKRRD